MAKITLEKLHAMLEGFVEHVMNTMPTKQEMNERFAQVDARFGQVDAHFGQVEKDIEQIKIDIYHMKGDMQHMKGDMQHMKGDMLQTKNDIKSLLNGMDAEAKQLDTIRSEQAAFTHALNRLEKRAIILEEKER